MSLSRCNCSRAVAADTSLIIAAHLHGLVLSVSSLARCELPILALVRRLLARRAHCVPQAAVVRSERATLHLHARLPKPCVRGCWRGGANSLEHVASRVAHHHFLRFFVPCCRHTVKSQPVLPFHAAQRVRLAVGVGGDSAAAAANM